MSAIFAHSPFLTDCLVKEPELQVEIAGFLVRKLGLG